MNFFRIGSFWSLQSYSIRSRKSKLLKLSQGKSQGLKQREVAIVIEERDRRRQLITGNQKHWETNWVWRIRSVILNKFHCSGNAWEVSVFRYNFSWAPVRASKILFLQESLSCCWSESKGTAVIYTSAGRMHFIHFFQNAVLHWPLQADHEKTHLTHSLSYSERDLNNFSVENQVLMTGM